MGSKLQPGAFDCYTAALPDEPMFILLARDRSAPAMLRKWSDTRRTQVRAKFEAGEISEDRLREDLQKCTEADGCADDMAMWRKANDGRWRDTCELRSRLSTPTDEQIAAVAAAAIRATGYASGLASQFHGVISVTSHSVRPWRSPLFAGRVHDIVLASDDRFDIDMELSTLFEPVNWAMQGMVAADIDVKFIRENCLPLSISVVVDA